MKKHKITALILLPAIIAAVVILRTLGSDKNSQPVGFANIDAFESISLTRKHNDRLIGRLEERLRRDGESARLLSRLGQAYLQQVRESGDFSYYRKAEQAFVKILEKYDANHVEAMA